MTGPRSLPREYPSPRQGVPQSQMGAGVTQPGQDLVPLAMDEGPPTRDGVPAGQDLGTPFPGQDGVPP